MIPPVGGTKRGQIQTEVEWWLPGAGGGECLMARQFCKMKSSGNRLCDNVSVLHITELYT